MTDFNLRRAYWSDDMDSIKFVREIVFVQEQKVPEALEWDGIDDKCLHLLAEDIEGKPIGTGRLQANGKIGRVAVLKEWRGRHVGIAIMEALIDAAREQKLADCYLDSQTYAVDFYHRFGFVEEGEEFLDADIPHKCMRLKL